MSARIHRIAFAVKDLDAAVEHYSTLFGCNFETTGEAVAEEAGVAVAANWALGLEIVQPLPGSENPIAQQMEQFLAERGEGIFGVGFSVQDMDGAIDVAKRAGVEPLLPTFKFTDQQLKDEFAGAYTRFEETVLATWPRSGCAIALNLIEDA